MAEKKKQYTLKRPQFEAYDKNAAIQDALGSRKIKQIQEIDELKSTNYTGSTLAVSPYRITRRGIHIQNLATLIALSLITNEVVSGSGTSFTLANTPVTGTVMLYGNGIRLTNTVDYSYSGSSISILVGSYSTGTIIGDYYKDQ